MRVTIFIISSFLAFVLFSCKQKCPLPSCKIRKQHHHALNFKNTKQYEKDQRLKEKSRLEEQERLAQKEADSLANYEAHQHEIDELDPEHDLALQQEQEFNSHDDETSKKKKGRKKDKNKESIEDDLGEGEDVMADASGEVDSYDPYDDVADEDDMDLAELDLDTKEAKKELKELNKLTKDQEKEAKKAAKRERAEMKEADKVYSGEGGDNKLWWKRGKNPEVGEEYDEPVRQEKKGINEYHW